MTSTSTARRGRTPQFKASTYKMLSLSSLKINSKYQRDPKDPQFQSMVKRIVEHFDPALLHALDVATWNGDFFVWDGYARLTALRILAEQGKVSDKVMCAVTEADQAEQARLFVDQTARRTVRWPDKHRARIVCGDPKAKAIERVFKQLGVSLGNHGDVRAVGAVYGTLDMGGEELLRDTVAISTSCWGGRQYGTSDRMLDGLALFLSEFGPDEVDRKDVRKAFDDVSPAALIKEVTARTSMMGSNNKTQVAVELLRQFNRFHARKLRAARLDPHRRAKKARALKAAAEKKEMAAAA